MATRFSGVIRVGDTPKMPKVPLSNNASALQALERYIYCVERGEAADHRAYCAGGSVTSDKHSTTANNWQEKADAALNALRTYLAA